MLGAGDMGEAMALGLAKAGTDLVVANRTWDTAVTLAARIGGRAVRLGDVTDALGDVDVLLTSTGAATRSSRRRSSARPWRPRQAARC